MSNIEQRIKSEYQKFFTQKDWLPFKQLAEYYLQVAATLRKRDVQANALRLWFRNVQKRLFIGVAHELLLKSYYLKQGYGINVPLKGKWYIYKIANVKPNEFALDRTYSFGFLIDQWRKHGPYVDNLTQIEKGFRIAKVFRNKEGHIAVYWHQFHPADYATIEKSLRLFYRSAFGQHLKVRFSMEAGEDGFFEVS